MAASPLSHLLLVVLGTGPIAYPKTSGSQVALHALRLVLILRPPARTSCTSPVLRLWGAGQHVGGCEVRSGLRRAGLVFVISSVVGLPLAAATFDRGTSSPTWPSSSATADRSGRCRGGLVKGSQVSRVGDPTVGGPVDSRLSRPERQSGADCPKTTRVRQPDAWPDAGHAASSAQPSWSARSVRDTAVMSGALKYSG